MKTILKILFAPLLWLFQGCSPLGDPVDPEKSDSHYYNGSKSEIRYSPMGNSFELGNRAMNADVESFEVLNTWLSKDKDHIYFEAYEVNNVQIDPSTFYIKNKDYMGRIGFDKNFVYAFDVEVRDSNLYSSATVVEDADPDTFINTDMDWANDGRRHFFRNHKIDADFDSFQPLNDYFAKDSSHIYVRNDIQFEAFEADVATMDILGESSHGFDKKNIYWLPFFTENAINPVVIPYADMAEVEQLNRYFLKIADTIYFDGHARPDIDSESFEIIDHSYAKDAKHVYYEDKVIPNADPTTFKKLENTYKYGDKNGIYNEGKLEAK